MLIILVSSNYFRPIIAIPVEHLHFQSSECSGIKGSMVKVIKSFTCKGCLNPVTSAGRTIVDIGASANLELMDKFCNLGDMLSVEGDTDAAVEARI